MIFLLGFSIGLMLAGAGFCIGYYYRELVEHIKRGAVVIEEEIWRKK